MPVKFVAEVVKGLFGLSEQSTDDAETETSITVERETNGESEAESSETEGSVDADEHAESGETVEVSADESEESTEVSADESGETVEPDDSEESAEPVDEITGIGPTYSERLADTGIETVADLADADALAVAEAAEVSESRAADWITQAADW
jgi:polyhydroxyalkanoate synthase